MPKRAQTVFATAWSLFEATIMLWITLYFMNSATRNWATVPLVGYVMQLFGLIGCFFIPESPKFLLEQNRLSELRKCLHYIANCNGKQIDFNVGSLRRYSDVTETSHDSP